MGKAPVSIVVITRNEEENIADCLDSVRWADEIIVVDDNSEDATREIASRYTDRIFVRKMENEGIHRNWAYDQASNEWILSIDADERVTPELAGEITDLVAGAPEYNGYTVPRRNHIGKYWLKWGGEYPAAQLRLFRKSEFRYEEAEVHPRALMEGDCGHLKGDFIHYSHKDFSDYVRSLNGHTTLEARKWSRADKKKTFGRALWRSLDRCFYRRLLRKQAWKDGVHGLTVAVFSGMYQLISWVKAWEMGHPEISGPDFVSVSDPASADRPAIEGREKLSVVVITRNAAAKIRNCMESIKWVDEIIVVDGGSSDETVAISREYGAKVIHSEFAGFDKERNKGADAASGDWILQLDADEIVTKAFKARLVRMLKGETDGCVSFKFRRRNIFLGRPMMKGGWYHYSAHLFRKDRARYEGDIHEKLVVNGEQGTMDEGVDHYPFLSLSEFIERQNRYTSIQAAEMFRNMPDVDEKEIMFNLKRKPIKLFRKMYIKKGGFREGMHGLVFSVLFAWVHYLKWLKYWEMRFCV